MTQETLLKRIKEQLRELYGSRFRGLLLYGSIARGDAGAESDIDLLCLLKGPVDVTEEVLFVSRKLYPLQLEYLDRVFSIMVADIEDYETGACPLCIEARKEGALV